MNIYNDWSKKWNDYSPNKIAISESSSGYTYTFKEIYLISNSIASYFKKIGLVKGDRIAILAENSIEYIVLIAAAQKSGIVLVPINYRLTNNEIDYLLKLIEPSMLISSLQFRSMMEDLNHNNLIHLGIEEFRNPEWEVLENLQVDIQDDDPLFIIFTSGSTGFPKGAIYSHKMALWNSLNTSMSLILNSETRTINCMPFFHTGGLNVLMLPIFHHGGYTSIMTGFDVDELVKLLEEEKPTIFMAVPTMLKIISKHERFKEIDLSSLLYIIVGGESMSTSEIKIWHEKGVYIRQGYGMTEVGPNLTSLHQDYSTEKIGSIGKPNFYISIRIVDQDNKDVAQNEIGELWIKSPVVTPGYWQNKEETEKSIEDGWFKTGDLVRQDEEGFLYIVDRIKNMYISGGENVFPVEIERILKNHDSIYEAVVIPVPDAKWGEVGKAIIQLNKNTNIIDMIELKSYCKKNLASYKIPKHFIFVKEMPMTDSNKVDRKKLRTVYT